MNLMLLTTVFAAQIITSQRTGSDPPAAPKSPVPAVVRANTEFAVNLHQQLRGEPGNLCYSPWSISTVLGLASAGAKGRTLDEMTRTLHLPNPQLTHAGVAALLRQMKQQRGYELSAANAVFVAKDLAWRKDFLDLTRKYYESSIFTVDFGRQPESARQSINGWVERQTRKRITNLVPAGSVNSNSKIVLVNALYFKGDWEKPFSKAETIPLDFFRTPTDKSRTPTMFQSDRFLYGENRDVQILGMPYKGGDLMMVLILPSKRNNLPPLEKDLNAELIQGWLARLEPHPKVDVYLPRFKIAYEIELRQTLERMGMAEPFTDNANFSGMTENNLPLKVDAVIHKAFVELQEEGTEAAAATAVAEVVGAAPGGTFTTPPPRPVFRADHPFLFGIIDRRSGSVLFMGRVSDPMK